MTPEQLEYVSELEHHVTAYCMPKNIIDLTTMKCYLLYMD
jgi:hypothetical protein